MVPETVQPATRDGTLRHLVGIDQYIISTHGLEWIDPRLALRGQFADLGS